MRSLGGSHGIAKALSHGIAKALFCRFHLTGDLIGDFIGDLKSDLRGGCFSTTNGFSIMAD